MNNLWRGRFTYDTSERFVRTIKTIFLIVFILLSIYIYLYIYYIINLLRNAVYDGV